MLAGFEVDLPDTAGWTVYSRQLLFRPRGLGIVPVCRDHTLSPPDDARAAGNSR